MTEEKNHHVAWKDRLGLNQQWMRDIQACSDAYGTPEYTEKVDRFKNNIVNINHGPPLRTIIETYFNQDLTIRGKELFELWKENHRQEAKIEEERSEKQEEIRKWQAERLYYFIIQTLEDHGFGFYESKYEEEDKMV